MVAGKIKDFIERKGDRAIVPLFIRTSLMNYSNDTKIPVRSVTVRFGFMRITAIVVL
jgi:hypothetical protein